jgi:AcrR family transcriptional regulator
MASDARGRPRTSSRASLEEAATELFLEQGYTQTTIEQITSRAGVSRATFFNYFSSKSDVLWLEVDEALSRLEERVTHGATLADSLADISEAFSSSYPPLIASHAEIMDAPDELTADAGKRIVRLSRIVAHASPQSDRVWITTGAIVQAALAWVDAGVNREHPLSYLRMHSDLGAELTA